MYTWIQIISIALELIDVSIIRVQHLVQTDNNEISTVCIDELLRGIHWSPVHSPHIGVSNVKSYSEFHHM